MIRLLLLLALALGQAQPVAAALLCEQHHAGQGESQHQDAGHHSGPFGSEPATPSDHQCTPMPHDCAVMTGCTITVPAMVPVHAGMIATTAPDRVRISYLLGVPPTVSAPRPFHPPKSCPVPFVERDSSVGPAAGIHLMHGGACPAG